LSVVNVTLETEDGLNTDLPLRELLALVVSNTVLKYKDVDHFLESAVSGSSRRTRYSVIDIDLFSELQM
jgi:hypothetical protein